MDSKTLVEAYQARIDGQLLLFEDYDYILRNTKFRQTSSPEFDKEAIIHWWMNVYVPSGSGDEAIGSQDIYSSWSDAIYANFKYIIASGYIESTKQSCVKICCVKSEELQPQIDELKLWLPHIKEIIREKSENNKKGKYIDIFEHTCSQNGCYHLMIYDDEVIIDKVTYGHYKILCKFNNLADIVDYIRKNLWYKK